MKRFAQLYTEVDTTTRTNEKVAAMARYLAEVEPADAAWAVHVLAGNRPKRLVPVRRLAAWAMEASATPDWLFEESYHAVGDLAETIALLLPRAERETDRPLAWWIEERLLALAGLPEERQRELVLDAWRELDETERFLFVKLITGELRVGVSRSLVVRAVSHVAQVDEATISHRLSGAWEPSADSWRRLLSGDTADADISRPYPFFLAYPLEDSLETLGEAHEWLVEWKWDGIRAQLIRRGGRTYLWSRGEEAVGDRFPEITEASALLADGTVIDGEIMPWKDDAPLPFAQLQRRIGRTRLGPTILREVPVVLIAYDLLEIGGEDVRERPMAWRRAELEALLSKSSYGGRLRLSPTARSDGWDDVRAAYEAARERCAEGLMLKRRDSAYGAGRRRGPWWKWKVAPFTVDAVMIYAQAGHGRRASLNTDYTFAVWDGDVLVPFAKAYSGLTDAEIRTLDAWIRRNTIEKFGPVRSVPPEQVFELAFEGIRASSRHKSGIAVRFPRILRWRTDKPAREADTLESLRALLRATSP